MDLNNFDKNIKSALENIEAPFDPNSWNALEHKMNAAFAEEHPSPVDPVDLVVKRTFERFEAPYQASDWNVLAAKMNKNVVATRIKYSKVAEAAIFLLLLANIEGFLGGFGEVLKKAAPAKPAVPGLMAENKGGKHGKKSQKGIATAQAASEGSVTDKVIALLAAPFLNVSSITNNSALENEALAQDLSMPVSNTVLDAANFYATSGITQFNKIAPIPHVQVHDMAWQTLFDIIPGVPTKITPQKSNGFYAASFGAFEDNKFQSSSYTVNENGFGGGVAVGYRKGKWGVESGVAYSNKRFTPKKELEIYAGSDINGFLGSYFSQVDADVVSVPVRVSRRFARARNASAHVFAGISAHVATQKRYGYQSEFIPATSPDPVPAPNAYQNPIPNKNANGLMEGGSLNGNAYVTADLGVRLEQSIGKRYTAFIEPSYKRALNGGFGPKREKIHTFALNAGIMAAL